MPSWYQGGFPDAERVVIDLLKPHLEMCTPTGEAVAWLPDPDVMNAAIDAGNFYVRVYRKAGATGSGTAGGRGGSSAADDRMLFDGPHVQLGHMSANREDSWRIAEFCRQIMLSYRTGGAVRRADGSLTPIQHVREIVGPQQIPELNPDHRLVPLTFEVATRLPRGLPDYSRVRPQFQTI